MSCESLVCLSLLKIFKSPCARFFRDILQHVTVSLREESRIEVPSCCLEKVYAWPQLLHGDCPRGPEGLGRGGKERRAGDVLEARRRLLRNKSMHASTSLPDTARLCMYTSLQSLLLLLLCARLCRVLKVRELDGKNYRLAFRRLSHPIEPKGTRLFSVFIPSLAFLVDLFVLWSYKHTSTERRYHVRCVSLHLWMGGSPKEGCRMQAQLAAALSVLPPTFLLLSLRVRGGWVSFLRRCEAYGSRSMDAAIGPSLYGSFASLDETSPKTKQKGRRRRRA